MRILQIDIETYSETDLIKCGVHRYTEDPAFTILLFGYAYNDETVRVIDLTRERLPESLLHDLTDPTIIKTAFNAAFERTCIAKHFGIACDAASWHCTAVWSLFMGLPGSLEKTAEVLRLEAQKDAKGKNLIKYFSVPCKPTKVNGGRTRNLPHHDPDKWRQFIDYCAQDVEVERAIRHKLNRFPVPDREWALWSNDQVVPERHRILVVECLTASLQSCFKKLVLSDLEQLHQGVVGLH